MASVPLPVPLITGRDLPITQVAGAIQNVDRPAILQNVGGAINYSVQSIVLRDNPHHLGGTVRFYLYQSSLEAINFYNRLTEHFEGQPTVEIGDEALIKTTPHILQFPESTTTAILLRRDRAVINIVGSFQPDPSFSQGYLTRENLVTYARQLDQRLVEAFAQLKNPLH